MQILTTEMAAAQPAGCGREGAGRNLVDVAVCDNDPRAGHHLGRQVAGGAERARVAGPEFPCLVLRRKFTRGRR